MTILRPPLVFGNNAVGNWAKLRKIIHYGLPFPDIFSNVYKSLISVDELSRIILLASKRFDLPRTSYVVSHPEPIDLSSLIDALYLSKFRNSRRVKLPNKISNYLRKLPNSSIKNLSSNLVIDPSNIIKDPCWEPTKNLLENQIKSLK